jgi:hypothetical protein
VQQNEQPIELLNDHSSTPVDALSRRGLLDGIRPARRP